MAWKGKGRTRAGWRSQKFASAGGALGGRSQRVLPRWGESDRAEEMRGKREDEREVTATGVELVVHGRVGVWRRAVEGQGWARKAPRQEGG